MKPLRLVLRWQAVLWAASGFAVVAAPGWVVEVGLGQPALGEDAWVRLAGVLSIALAAQMVLVARRVEELWWWSWTFVLLEVATALVVVLNALVGLSPDAAAWPLWTRGIVNAGLAGLEIAALAKAGTERSPL